MMSESYLFRSTNVVAATYEPTRHRLTVEFKGQRKYRYSKVPPKVWKEFKQSASPGTFIFERLSMYSYTPI